MRDVRRSREGAGWEAAVEWAREIVGDPRTVYLDTETTGLDGGAEIVEVAVVAGDGRVLVDTLVRPVRPIPLDAARIHGIRDADVVSAPDWCVVHTFLARVLADRRVIVYNADFDRRMVGQCCRLHGLTEPDCAWECAMRTYAAFRGEARGRRGGFRWHRLEDAARTFGIESGWHRALGDAIACRAVVAGMAEALDD